MLPHIFFNFLLDCNYLILILNLYINKDLSHERSIDQESRLVRHLVFTEHLPTRLRDFLTSPRMEVLDRFGNVRGEDTLGEVTRCTSGNGSIYLKLSIELAGSTLTSTKRKKV